MSFTDPENTTLDALFLRAAKHAEVKVELCRALLEAELFTLILQGPVDGAELVEVETAGDIPFKLWMRDGKPHFFVYTPEAVARKGLRKFTDPLGEPQVAIGMEGRQMRELICSPDRAPFMCSQRERGRLSKWRS